MYVTDEWPIYCSVADISIIMVGVRYTCHPRSLMKPSPIVNTLRRDRIDFWAQNCTV